jgi:hypothetical protein
MHDLEDYRGLPMSCKQVNSEFDDEWAKVFVSFLDEVIEPTDFHIQPVTKLSDSARLRVGLERRRLEGYECYTESALIRDVTRLLNAFPSFFIYPISSFPEDIQPLTPEQIARVKLGSKRRKTRWFLHTMKMTAADTRRWASTEPRFLIGEDYVDIEFNYAWPGVEEMRKGKKEWAIVDRRRRVFGTPDQFELDGAVMHME